MRIKIRPLLILLAVIIGVAIIIRLIGHVPMDVLNPAGLIASEQKRLLITATLLMLLIVIPVFGLTFYIAYTYRATNKKARYQPEWDRNTKLETIWWGFPLLIVAILAALTWGSSHSLDPSRPLASNKQPLTIQVVALQWKWLFIYPEQQIATVNYVKFPADRPVRFQITADAPMNSFWIPRLGGQIYAMAGMTTELNLMADRQGSFHGSSANLSGEGFAAMRFTAEASSEEDFDRWIRMTRSGNGNLSLAAYSSLSLPGVPRDSPAAYASYEPGLYDTVLMKYMNSPHAMAGSSND